MKLTLALAAAATATAAGTEAFTFCDDGSNALAINDFDVSVADGALNVAVNAEHCMAHLGAEVQVKLFGIPVATATVPLNKPTSSMRGSVDEGAAVKQASLSFPLPDNFGDWNVPLDVEMRLTGADSQVSECVAATVKAGTVAHEDTVLSTQRFGLEPRHVEVLFKKWLEHFEAELPVAMDDAEKRFEIFRANLLKIMYHNQGDDSYTMSMNQFGHMTEEEFGAMMLGGFKPHDYQKSLVDSGDALFQGERNTFSHDGSALPDQVDWTTKGAVTPVKNQGACGSCWSFATTGSLEGAYFLKYGKLVSFSEEQLVTCDHVDMGCNGGLMDNAFAWIERNGGLCSESQEPYVSGSGRMPKCSKCTVVPNSAPKKYTDVEHKPTSLKAAVAQQPVAVAIEADQFAFQFYGGGVLKGRCGSRLDHGVLVVGYGTDKGTEFWKVKNSWGPTWGMKGYINLQREKSVNGGECGILMSASYPSF